MPVTWSVVLQWVGFFCGVGAVFACIYIGLRKLGVTRERFWEGVAFYFILLLVLRFIYREAQRLGWDWIWFSSEGLFYCMMGFVLGVIAVILRLGDKRFGVMWRVFLKALVFCGFMGVVFCLAYVETRRVGLTGIFWKGLVVAALVECFLVFAYQRAKSEAVVRLLFFLKAGLFYCMLCIPIIFARVEVKHLGRDWIWFSSECVFLIMWLFALPFIYEGVRCVRVAGEAFCKWLGLGVGRARST